MIKWLCVQHEYEIERQQKKKQTHIVIQLASLNNNCMRFLCFAQHIG